MREIDITLPYVCKFFGPTPHQTPEVRAKSGPQGQKLLQNGVNPGEILYSESKTPYAQRKDLTFWRVSTGGWVFLVHSVEIRVDPAPPAGDSQ